MREELIEALQRLARGHVDAAETIVDLVMPRVADPRDTFDVTLADLQAQFEAEAVKPKKKAK